MKENRRLLQEPVDEGIMQTTLSPDPVRQPINGSSEPTTIRRHYQPPTSLLDSSMALTILVLLTAIFFMGFFSIYIRRFSQEESSGIRRRRQPSRPSSSSPGLYNKWKGKGLDPTTIQALPLVSYSESAKQLITECPICLSEFQEKEILKSIPHCTHVFHPQCLDTWLSSHVSCPLCRSTQFFNPVGNEVCLDVKEVESSNGMSELHRSATSGEGSHLEVRRTCSYGNLRVHVVLQRSMSF